MLEQLLVEKLGPLGAIIAIMVITGVVTSFINEAIDRINPVKKQLKIKAKTANISKWKFIRQAWYTNFLITIAATFVVLMAFRGLFDMNPDPEIFEYDVWDIVLAAFVNFSFSIVFYQLGGKRVVKAIVTKLGIKKIEDQLD